MSTYIRVDTRPVQNVNACYVAAYNVRTQAQEDAVFQKLIPVHPNYHYIRNQGF